MAIEITRYLRAPSLTKDDRASALGFGTSKAVTISSAARAVRRLPVTNCATAIVLVPRGEASSTRASSAIRLGVPSAAVLYGPSGPTVQVVTGNRVETRRVRTGLAADALVEVREGLAEGDTVVARAGTFLRDGDTVRPVPVAAARVETQ